MTNASDRTTGRSTSGTSRTALATVVALATAMGLCSPVAAQGPPAKDQKAELEARRRQLQETESRAKALQTDVAELAAERERLNQRLLETAALIQRSEAQLDSIEARLGELEAQEKLVRGSLDQRNASIGRLLGALQRMGRNPPPVMITRREDALSMVRSAMLLAAAFPELRTQALALSARLNELVRIMSDIRSEGDRLKAETVRLSDARTRLAGLMETKRQSLAERQAELEGVRRATADMQRSVGDLTEMLQRIDKAVAEQTGLGAYERELRAAAADPNPPPAPATTPGAAPPAAPDAQRAPTQLKPPPSAGAPVEPKVAVLVPQKPSIVELAPASRGTASPGRLAPAVPFHLAKGRLPLPSQGRRTVGFGERTHHGSQSKGIVIETREGGQITSPADGWIVFAGPFRGYGQLLIINAGGGYHILLAGLSQIDVQLGQFVLAAEPVGTMSVTPRSAATKSGAPVLYVEFRKDGKPIDPDPWWVSNGNRLQASRVQG